MENNTLINLVNNICDEILSRNTLLTLGKDVIPLSTKLFPSLAEKFDLNLEKVPELVDVLTKSKMIFSFPVNESEEPTEVIYAFVVTKGPVISNARKTFDEIFEKLYTHEFSKKVPVEKLLIEFSLNRKDFNNTPLGIAANISLNLLHYQSVLERNILQYTDKIKETLLTEALKKCGPLSDYIAQKEEPEKKATAVKNIPMAGKNKDQKRRGTDSPKYDEFKVFDKLNSIEKTLKVYGVEFYVKVCFRDYQFDLVKKLISEGHITKENDLKTVKKLLEKVRQNADQDIKVNEHARDINALLKIINDALKALGRS